MKKCLSNSFVFVFENFRFAFSVELIRRPSYATRYRTTRSRQVDEVSPQRRTAVVRRVPDSDLLEGKTRKSEIRKKKNFGFSF